MREIIILFEVYPQLFHGLSALTAASAVSAARTQQQKAAAQAIAMMCLVFICVP